MNRKAIAIVIILLIAALVAWFFWPESTPNFDEHIAENSEAGEGLLAVTDAQIRASGIALHRVSRGGVSAEIIAPASVKAMPDGAARLDARADGTITQICKSPGDAVAKGETLIVLQSAQAAQYEADIASARAMLSQAQASHAREKRLFDARVTARQDLEAAQTQLALARAELQRARSSASAAGVSGGGSIAIRSPISGRVTKSSAILGSFASTGTALMEVVDPARIRIEAAISASDAPRIAAGDSAEIRIYGQEITGRVRSISPALDPQSRTATAIIIPDRLIPELQGDAFVEVSISASGGAGPDIIAIPEDALQQIDGKSMVFVRKAGGFRPVAVETGARTAGQVSILSGLKGGEMIATENAFLLKAELEKSENENAH